MSTAYYRLREPITSVQLDEGPGHDRLRIWQDHGFAGELVLTAGAGREVARMFFETNADDAHCAIHAYYGGDERGCVVTVNDPTLPESAVVLDGDTDEVLTVGEVRAFDGRGRRVTTSLLPDR